MNIAMAVSSIGFLNSAMLPLFVENPPVAVVENAWFSAVRKSSPSTMYTAVASKVIIVYTMNSAFVISFIRGIAVEDTGPLLSV